jgi:hypothetical protein
MVAEFESDLIRLRTREGMKVAKAKGRLRGKQPKLNHRQEAHLVSWVHSDQYSTAEVAELFGVGRSTVYRAIERQRIGSEDRSRGGDREALTPAHGAGCPVSDTQAGRRRVNARSACEQPLEGSAFGMSWNDQLLVCDDVSRIHSCVKEEHRERGFHSWDWAFSPAACLRSLR